jgi:hypothetical protein
VSVDVVEPLQRILLCVGKLVMFVSCLGCGHEFHFLLFQTHTPWGGVMKSVYPRIKVRSS